MIIFATEFYLNSMKYPIGMQSFDQIINGGFVYVDKTDLVYQLAQGHVCFLGRPRRFGKSLLVSTLENYFLGRKELFKGLAMESLETEWKQYPVFHIDFSVGNYLSDGALVEALGSALSNWEAQYGIQSVNKDLGLRFQRILRAAHEQTGLCCVVLIDEYKVNVEMPLPMIYQSGYLTIKDYDKLTHSYLLDIPNNEVREGFAPYRRNNEREYERYFGYTFFLLLKMLSCYLVYRGKETSQGRADCVYGTPNDVYIFEFKLDGSVDAALKQIEEKGYAREYTNDSRKIHLVGVNFSSEKGTIDDRKEL